MTILVVSHALRCQEKSEWAEGNQAGAAAERELACPPPNRTRIDLGFLYSFRSTLGTSGIRSAAQDSSHLAHVRGIAPLESRRQVVSCVLKPGGS